MQAFFEKNKQRLTVLSLPSYSSDYNPIEKLWKEIKKEGTHLHYFPKFNDLIVKVEEILLNFSNSCQKVLSLFGFYKELTAVMDTVA